MVTFDLHNSKVLLQRIALLSGKVMLSYVSHLNAMGLIVASVAKFGILLNSLF